MQISEPGRTAGWFNHIYMRILTTALLHRQAYPGGKRCGWMKLFQLAQPIGGAVGHFRVPCGYLGAAGH